MKKLFAVVLIATMSAGLFSCGDGGKVEASAVPSQVVAAFNSKYPDASATEWKTEKSDGKKVYEAAFKSGGKDIEAEFFEDGTFKQED